LSLHSLYKCRAVFSLSSAVAVDYVEYVG